MQANLNRWSFLAVLPAALLALVLASMPLGARAETAKAMSANDLVTAATQSITTVTLAEAKDLLGKPGVVFLDVREVNETVQGTVPGAVNIPRGMLEFLVANQLPDKDAQIVVYCSLGGRGALAAETLGKMGYKNAVNMKGGYDAWVVAGKPVR